MITFIVGGVRSGKSSYGEQLALKGKGRKVYIATAIPFDGEMKKRIDQHIEDRGKAFLTFESPFGLEDVVKDLSFGDVVLLDCLTVLVNNMIYKKQEEIPEKIIRWMKEIHHKTGNLILVSNDIFKETKDSYSEETLDYLKVLGMVHKQVAKASDVVIEMQFGIKKVWKGDLL